MISGYRLIPSNGTKEVLASTGERGGWKEIPSYPPSPRGLRLRDVRLDLRMGLREAAQRLGLTAVEYGRLEYGAAECDWNEAELALRTEAVHG